MQQGLLSGQGGAVRSLPRRQGPWLKAFIPHRAEGLILAAMAGTAALILMVSLIKDQAVDWPGLGRFLLAGTGFIGLAAWQREGRPRLAAALFAVGAFVNLGNLVGTLLFLRFPLGHPTIDPLLQALDARLLGYDWAGAVAWTAANPPAGPVLAVVYHSALPQIVLLMVLLAGSARMVRLRRFQLSLAFSLGLTGLFWWLIPSLGPSVLESLDPAMAEAAHLVVGEAYRATLIRLATEGSAVVTTDHVTGVIAFPSYHMVMAILVTWHARGTLLGWPLLLINLVMIPATMIQGAHHAMDLLGGLVAAGLGLGLARLAVPEKAENGGRRDAPHAGHSPSDAR